MLIGYFLKNKLADGVLLNLLAFVIFSVFGMFTLRQGLQLLFGISSEMIWPIIAVVIILYVLFVFRIIKTKKESIKSGSKMKAIEYLNEIKKYGSVPGLDSIKRLLNKLGNPQDQLRIIHIAGTNGKGSILAMLESVFHQSGYRTGRYHSPVLFDTREAFQVDGMWITEEKLQQYVDRVKKAADEIVDEGFAHPTSFEVETAIAFAYFSR